MWLAAST
ncbi:hypothetical protein D023_3569A, partial [Vibrio parahaemolyticus 3256]